MNDKEILTQFGFDRNTIKDTSEELWLEEMNVDIKESDFYPPKDNRELKSGVCDIGLSTFHDFVEEFNLYIDEAEIYE